MRGFLGLAPLIADFCKKAHPFFQLLQEKPERIWKSCHTRAVGELEEALITTASVQICDPDKRVVVKADASKYATGAVLEQERRPIAFGSKKTAEREQQVPAYESELRAIVHALSKWRQFIGARTVTNETNRAPLGTAIKQWQANPRLGY